MNFLSAIKHAIICYGIRRKVWVSGAILSLGNGHTSDTCQLYWLDREKDGKRCVDPPCKLLGPDKTHDLQAEDLIALDWEAI